MNCAWPSASASNFARLPLSKSPTIVHGNALRIDWNDVVPAARLSYILGNPPFLGHHYQSRSSKADQAIAGCRGHEAARA